MTQNPNAVPNCARDMPSKHHQVAIESVGNQRVALHVILRKDYGEVGEFNESRSWYSFRKIMQGRILKEVSVMGKTDVVLNRKNLNDQRFRVYLFNDDWEFEYDAYARMAERSGMPNEYDILPRHYHTSVYSFYEIIGYERSRRKLKSWMRSSQADVRLGDPGQ